MSIYPSLEDMRMDQMMMAQATPVTYPTSDSLPYPTASIQSGASAPNNQLVATAPGTVSTYNSKLYPDLFNLNDYMGLNLTSNELNHLTVSLPFSNQTGNQYNNMIAPISSSSTGLQRAQISHGLREVNLCKDGKGKIGMRVKDLNRGVFVVLVTAGSPAAMVGLRFGDQILQINGENVAGYSIDKVHNIFKKCPQNGINLIVRDRPFERTVTLHKNSNGHVGFTFKKGRIDALVKDSSAARNGLLTEHNLLEVNGQNVVGLEDRGVCSIIENAGPVVTLTIMPSIIYDHMMKQMASSLVKKLMDHSIPEL